jgi:hypothetical protein
VLENLEKFKPPSRCAVSELSENLKPNDSELLEKYLADHFNWGAEDLSLALEAVGLTLPVKTIEEHREKKCRCFWKAPYSESQDIESPIKARIKSNKKDKRTRTLTKPIRMYNISIETLIEQGLIKVGEAITSRNQNAPGTAIIYEDGNILFDGNIYSAISAAAIACKRKYNPDFISSNGWEFWGVMRNGELVSLKSIRDAYLEGKAITPSNEISSKSTSIKEVVSILDLISSGLLAEDSIIFSADKTKTARVSKNQIAFESGPKFKTLKDAAKFAEYGTAESEKYLNGWKYWHYLEGNKLFPLSKLRDSIISLS